MIRSHMASATKRGRAASAEAADPAAASGNKRRRELTKAPTRMVRGVMMTAFDITTDTEKELEASRAANRHAQAVDLARSLAVQVEGESDDSDEAREQAQRLADLLKLGGEKTTC